MLFIEGVCSIEILFAKEAHVPAKCPWTYEGADPVVHGISEDRGDDQQHHDQP
jgi:hypothetical protein